MLLYIYIMLILGSIKKKGGNIMSEKLKSSMLEKVGSLAVNTLKLSANTTSSFIAHQPKLPKDFQQFKKK
jgi:cyclic lactone autoinducer peptide